MSGSCTVAVPLALVIPVRIEFPIVNVTALEATGLPAEVERRRERRRRAVRGARRERAQAERGGGLGAGRLECRRDLVRLVVGPGVRVEGDEPDAVDRLHHELDRRRAS